MGYHKKIIERGVYGQSSKILEEVNELIDAEQQDAKIMALHELSDIVGAIKGYLGVNYPGFTFNDLIKMADITRSAFEDGERNVK